MTSDRRALRDVAATHALARELVEELLARDGAEGPVLALVGDLGAGKTELVRGVAVALGVPDPGAVCSPSYLALCLHAGARATLAHYDAYFLGGPDDLERAHFPELRRDGCLIAVEWADRVAPALPGDALWLELSEDGEQHFARRLPGPPEEFA